MTSEKLVTRFRKGRMTTMWVLKDEKYKRNEPLDLRNYATAALEITNPPILTKQNSAPPKQRQGRRRLNGGIG